LFNVHLQATLTCGVYVVGHPANKWTKLRGAAATIKFVILGLSSTAFNIFAGHYVSLFVFCGARVFGANEPVCPANGLARPANEPVCPATDDRISLLLATS
jgi:hypothetical protein